MTVKEAEKYLGKFVITGGSELGILFRIHPEDPSFPFEITFGELADGSPDTDFFYTFDPVSEDDPRIADFNED